MKTEHYFRELDQKFERTPPKRLPYYWPEGDMRRWCSYCRAPLEQAHPIEAQDVCPVYERFVADQ